MIENHNNLESGDNSSENSKERQNRVSQGILNFLKLVESLKNNKYYQIIKDSLMTGLSLTVLREHLQTQLELINSYLTFISAAEEETKEEGDLDEIEAYHQALSSYGLPFAAAELEVYKDDLDQALAWLAGLIEVSTTELSSPSSFTS